MGTNRPAPGSSGVAAGPAAAPTVEGGAAAQPAVGIQGVVLPVAPPLQVCRIVLQHCCCTNDWPEGAGRGVNAEQLCAAFAGTAAHRAHLAAQYPRAWLRGCMCLLPVRNSVSKKSKRVCTSLAPSQLLQDVEAAVKEE